VRLVDIHEAVRLLVRPEPMVLESELNRLFPAKSEKLLLKELLFWNWGGGRIISFAPKPPPPLLLLAPWSRSLEKLFWLGLLMKLFPLFPL